MAPPAQVTVTGSVISPFSGATITGSVTFELSEPLATSDTFVGTKPDGTFAVVAGDFSTTPELYTTDGSGALYLVRVQSNAWTGTFRTRVPATPSSVSFAWLWGNRLGPSSVPQPSWPSALFGQPGGFATLGQDGILTASQRPSGGGGGGSVDTVNGVSPDGEGNVQIDASDVGADVDGAAAAVSAALTPQINAKYTKPAPGIPAADLTTAAQTALTEATTAYQKPGGGIPEADLASAVQVLLGAADTAYQKPVDGIPATDLSAAVQAALAAAAGAFARPTVRLARITSGTFTLPNTSGTWEALEQSPDGTNPGALFELSVPAAAGDYVEIGSHGMRTSESGAWMDIAVMVGSTAVRYLSSNSATPSIEGDPGNYPVNTLLTQSGDRGIQVQAGDLDGGNVRFVIMVKAAGSGKMYAGDPTTDYVYYWRAVNWHGVDFQDVS